MKKVIILLSACVCLTPVFALPTFEPFVNATASGGTAYANGAPLCHQTNSMGEGWAQWNGGTTTSWVSCSNAAYLPGQADNSGGVSGLSAALNLSRSIRTDTNNLTTNKIFASFYIQVPNLGNLSSSSPIYFGGFATNTGDQNVSLPASAVKIFLKGNSGTAGLSTSWAIGIANNTGSGSAHYDSGGHTSSSILFVVVDYEFGISGNADVARIWVLTARSLAQPRHPLPPPTSASQPQTISPKPPISFCSTAPAPRFGADCLSTI
jgi:hypothetical protein